MSASLRVYPHLLDPTEHPDYTRRAVRPPTWQTFEGRTQFTCLRAFDVKDGRIVGHEAEIEKYVRRHGLGRVIWPSYPVLFASNLGELADTLVREGLYLFDIWGYVPGSGPGGYWLQFKAPAEALRLLEARLGDRWLGTDIGEQDGRYINGYAGQMTPASASRLEQYFNFQRHFERMGDDLGHRHAALVSLNFGHYFLKEGTFTIIGAETGQALPNNQVYYAFIRGAGKQYGVPWFGNASVWNRWGFKSYTKPGVTDGFDFGPTKGTSLSLLKRLLYTHVLYNGMLAGFEANWIEDGALTPIGLIQQSAVRWLDENGPPGIMHTPVALMVDFHAGWSFPRHLYTDRVYRVWGNLPYHEGDFLTEAILDLLYPGYQDSSYFRDESGFNTPTPFGDIADCILSDAESWLLQRYAVVVLAGELTGGAELRDKLEAFLRGGGHVAMTSGNLAKFPGGLAGTRSVTTTTRIAVGKGWLTIFATPFGVRLASLAAPIKSEIDRALPRPYMLEDEVREGLSELFRSQMLFEVTGSGLSIISCRRQGGEYTIGIANNTWTESPFRIASRCGAILAVRELSMDASEKSAIGYLPETVVAPHLGQSGPATIAGGDIRIFVVKVAESSVIETVRERPANRPTGRWLTLRDGRSIKEAILARPTFFEHFDGVVVDWKYVHERESKVLGYEARWLARQKIRVGVDLSSGVNFYPGLSLIDNQLEDYDASLAIIAGVLEKMGALGARDLILTPHRAPENNFAPAQATDALEQTLKTLATEAQAGGVTLHLRVTFEKAAQRWEELADAVGRIALPNLKIAPSISVLLASNAKLEEVAPKLAGKVGLWLCAARRDDVSGHPCDFHAPVHLDGPTDERSLREWLKASAGLPLVFDAVLAGPDEEYRESRRVAELTC